MASTVLALGRAFLSLPAITAAVRFERRPNLQESGLFGLGIIEVEVFQGFQHRARHNQPGEPFMVSGPSQQSAFLFDLDGTLVDSVYQHVLAWREALEAEGIELSVWRILRR
jgi:hypothetical protein